MRYRTRMAAVLSVVAALGVVGTESAAAHTLSAKKARSMARGETRALYNDLRRDGEDAINYGVDRCRRLSGHILSCVTYIEFPLTTCTFEWAVGYADHRQRRPRIAFMDDSLDCFRN